MGVLVFEAWNQVRNTVKYCKRNHKPLAEFTFRGRIYVIERLSRVGWTLWRGRVRAARCKKSVFKICPCFFFQLSATIILIFENLGIWKRSPDSPETEASSG